MDQEHSPGRLNCLQKLECSRSDQKKGTGHNMSGSGRELDI